jgi:type II secretory pathway pseudopilin PulG
MKGNSMRESGLTLVELLAAVVSVGLVLGAASGLAITSAARQKLALSASQLEAQHSELAQAIFTAIKTADTFQIFESSSSADMRSPTAYGAGEPGGNYLTCRHYVIADSGADDLIEQDFELTPGSRAGSLVLVQTTRFPLTGLQEARKEFTDVIATGPVFSMQNGIPQAHWSVATTMDRADFNVYAMPLSMR